MSSSIFPLRLTAFLTLSISTRIALAVVGTNSLAENDRARELLAAARSYLPSDWRYPKTDNPVGKKVQETLSRLLPVTIREQPTAFTCGPASLGILLSHYGVNLSDDELAQRTKVNEEGVDPFTLAAVARDLGFAVTEKYNATPDDVVKALRAGDPVLIDFQASYERSDDLKADWGHYSVIVAADEKDFLVADPSLFNLAYIRRIPRADLPKVWWDGFIGSNKRFDGWMMTIHRTTVKTGNAETGWASKFARGVAKWGATLVKPSPQPAR
jgi:predicted double-glycine peptidase